MPATNPTRAVVVTRPLAQASGFARRVAAMGRDPVIFPLLEIHPLADDSQLRVALDVLQNYALAAFVSSNAIDAAFAYIKAWPASVLIAVIGEGSKAALAAHGVTDANATIISPRNAERTDSETLLEALDLPGLRGRKALILRGESGRELLAQRLTAAGCDVVQVAAYRRSAPVWTPVLQQQLQSLLAGDNDWVITSSEALRTLVQLVGHLHNADCVAKMQQQRIVAPHARIAETARHAGFSNVHLTGSGDERLLAALQFTA